MSNKPMSIKKILLQTYMDLEARYLDLLDTIQLYKNRIFKLFWEREFYKSPLIDNKTLSEKHKKTMMREWAPLSNYKEEKKVHEYLISLYNRENKDFQMLGHYSYLSETETLCKNVITNKTVVNRLGETIGCKKCYREYLKIYDRTFWKGPNQSEIQKIAQIKTSKANYLSKLLNLR